MNDNSLNSPEISVILSVYNGAKYISEAIESILNQTFRDFELIVINDGCTDATPAIIESYSDPRIIYLQNGKNIGIAKSLNKGLGIARGRYIAIMDADDISKPERFSKQFTFLENNPDVGVCGTWINIIDKNGNFVGKTCYPTSSIVISCFLLFYCCIANPTTMYRKKIIQDIGNYNYEFKSAMDYDLWTRTIVNYKISNIPEFLLNYRIHGDNISGNREKHHHEQDYRIRKRSIEKLLDYPLASGEDIALKNWINPELKMQLNDIELIDKLLEKIFKKFLLTNKLNQVELDEISLFFAYQTINLANLAKQTSKIAYLKFVIRGFRYYPAIIPIILKQKLSRFQKKFQMKPASIKKHNL